MHKVLLIAEDNRRLKLLGDRVWAADCIAYCARTRVEALDLLRAGLSVDLVLVDAAMGARFLAMLRKDVTQGLPHLSRLPIEEMVDSDRI